MARTARFGLLETRTSRLRLKPLPAAKPYFTRTGKAGVHLGYRPGNPKAGESNGSWTVRRYAGEGKYETETFAEADDYSEADGHSILTYHQAMAKLGGELSELQVRKRCTVAQAMDEWLEGYKSRARSPMSIKQTVLKVKRIKEDLGERFIDDLTTESLLRWRNAIAGAPPRVKGKRGSAIRERERKAHNDAERMEAKRQRQATADRLWRTLTPALNLAWEHGKVSSADAWRRVKPFKGASQPRTRFLSSEESTQLINSADSSFRHLIHAALLTGCRWSEVRNLQVGDFHAASETLSIRNSKGGTDRNIPLTTEGVAFFEELTAGRAAHELIFTKDGGPWGEVDQLRRMKAACDAAKIKPIGYHGLRHTYGSLLAGKGVPMAVIAEAMGHSDTRMTEKHYAHLRPSYVAEQIRAHLPAFTALKKAKVEKLRQ